MYAWRRIFTLDPRSIRLFRCLLGTGLVADAISRWDLIDAFYSDAGIFPRDLLAAQVDSPHRFSLLMLSGSWWWVALNLGMLVALGLALVSGARVRWVSWMAFALVVSLQHRDAHLSFGADLLLRLGLLWSALLPAKGESNSPVVTAAVLLQITMIYLCSGWGKLRPDWWDEPEAVYYALSLDYYATHFGQTLRAYPALLRPLTRAVFLLERGGWLLFFSPWGFAACRLTAITLFVAFHVGLVLTMELGLFPFLDVTFLCLLLPTEFWGWLGRPRARIWRPPARHAGIAASILILFISWWNICELAPARWHLPARVGWAMRATGTAQGWSIFAPAPWHESGWFVGQGRRADGTMVNALLGTTEAPTSVPPTDVAQSLPNPHWLQFLVQVGRERRTRLRENLADYLCRNWTKRHGESLRAVDFIYYERPAPPPGTLPDVAEPRLLVHRDCATVP